MIATLLALATLQTTKFEPVFGGIAEAIVGIRPHPEQRLILYMRRSQINAYFVQKVRQSANDPWIRVGETRTAVKEVQLEGFPCLLLESHATRDVLANNPMEGEIHPQVVRKIARTRRVWVAEDGSILKTEFAQSQPESFSIDILYGDGVIDVHKIKDGKKESAQVEVSVDPTQFESEFLSMAWGKQIFKQTKRFASLDPFSGNLRKFEAKMYGPFAAMDGKERVNGYRVDVKEGTGTSIAWVTQDGRLLQLDLANGERLMVEPKEGDNGTSNFKIGG